MCLGAKHVEKAVDCIQRIPDSEDDDLSFIRAVQWKTYWEVGFVDPALVFDDSFSFEARILQASVESELHFLI